MPPSVTLRTLKEDDLDAVYRWSQDAEFCLANGWTPGLSHRKLQAWWLALLRTPASVMVRRGIVHQEQLVGFVELSHLQGPWQQAHFGIAIGERALWGQGIGFQASLQMLEHGFADLQLQHICAEVHAPNLRSLALMKKLGFQQVRKLRQHEIYRGELADVVVLELSQETWTTWKNAEVLTSAS